MFDEYLPDPPLQCPVCGADLDGWQGKNGPCTLFVWKQGVDQTSEHVKNKDELFVAELDELLLPERFTFYTTDEAGHWVTAEGRAVNGVWKTSRIIEVLGPRGSVGERPKRLFP